MSASLHRAAAGCNCARPAGEFALAAPLSVDDLATSLERLRADGRLTPAVESLVGRVLTRHRPPDAPALVAALAAGTPLKRLVTRRRSRGSRGSARERPGQHFVEAVEPRSAG
ncbi:MAG: hypothetical protein Q8S73_34260 [Deltaproteobacteria bacterium]|nr:hypothetical protein [Myxococcales bacterium]MDP3219213.1 hypothetical protein [Deltaproteobacteria bacterium]